MDGASGLSSSELDYGTGSGEAWGDVLSVHAHGIDQPVAVRKPGHTTVVPHANWMGDYEIGTTAAGTATTSCNGASNCPIILWPGSKQTVDGQLVSHSAINTWWGTLITEKTDPSGYKYMRNRYYNPQTGQFTQQDPIGLAGGMNLYGFADGDPVNFGDPFGLCPQWLTGRPCSGSVDAGVGFVPGVSTGIDIATALTGENPLTGDKVGVLGRGIALAGVLTPVSGGQIRAAGRFLSAAERALGKEAGNTFEVIVRKTLGSDGSSAAHLVEKNAAGRSVSVTHRVVDQQGRIIHQHQRHVGRSGAERRFPQEWIQFPDINRR